VGLHASRVDENVGSGIVIREISELIERAEFIICDLTLERPNVYYELGDAHGAGNEGGHFTHCQRRRCIAFRHRTASRSTLPIDREFALHSFFEPQRDDEIDQTMNGTFYRDQLIGIRNALACISDSMRFGVEGGADGFV
jgi:hypothetical protein